MRERKFQKFIDAKANDPTIHQMDGVFFVNRKEYKKKNARVFNKYKQNETF